MGSPHGLQKRSLHAAAPLPLINFPLRLDEGHGKDSDQVQKQISASQVSLRMGLIAADGLP